MSGTIHWDGSGNAPQIPSFVRYPNEEDLLVAGTGQLSPIMGIAGYSIIGPQGNLLGQISIVQFEGDGAQPEDQSYARGWVLNLSGNPAIEGHPLGWQYFDTRDHIPSFGIWPNVRICIEFVVTDEELIQVNADRSKLRDLARYFIPFISDYEPPEVLARQLIPDMT